MVGRLFERVMLGLIGFYRHYISALKGRPCCRYLPSCSEYAEEAIRCRGVGHGTLLMFWRILRCNPFVTGGYDPVPPRSGVK